jgi:hypothetical protein
MKKLVVVLAVAFSGIVFAQPDSVITQEILDAMDAEINIRREIGGYKPDKTEKFEPVLKKLIEGRLDVDSLESKQRALYRINVNDFDINRDKEHAPILTYFRNFNLDKIKDTINFEVEYDQSEFIDGERTETVALYDKSTRKLLLYMHLIFETHSNLIYNLHVERVN